MKTKNHSAYTTGWAGCLCMNCNKLFIDRFSNECMSKAFLHTYMVYLIHEKTSSKAAEVRLLQTSLLS